MESVFLWVGLVLVAIVLLALLRDDWLFITRPLLRAEGEVVRHDKSFSDGDDAWRAVFAFTDEDGYQHDPDGSTAGKQFGMLAAICQRPALGAKRNVN